MRFKRDLASVLSESLRRGRSTLLLGPRQTGKSTLIGEVCRAHPLVLSYPLQLPSYRTRLEADPESLRREVEAVRGRPVVFIDEIQKVPALLDVIQYLLDRRRMTLVASGSSARKLRRGGANWLPGRIHLEHLHPLTWRESGLLAAKGVDPARVADRLLYGGLPGILAQRDLADREQDLAAYATLYLEEEIRQEAAVRSLAPFSQFLRLAALESGTSPNQSQLAQQVGVTHTAVRGYYQLLEDSLVVHRLGAFGQARAAVLRRPRYYFFDIGVRNAAAGVGHHRGLLVLEIGKLIEHLVVLEAVATVGATGRLSYWRTKEGSEVDLVIERQGGVFGVEVKATAKPRERDFAGLAAFQRAERSDGAYLLCQVDRPQKFEGGVALPWWRLRDVWGG